MKNELREKEILDNYYKDLHISKDSHPSNIKAIAKFLIKTSFANMRKKWNPDSWTLETHQTVNVVNAYYSPYLNEFTIPAGYLQNFTYDFEHPMYLNFATTATTVGHEIIHGFDDQGRLFDENGKRQSEPGWWSKDTNANYNARAECIGNEYSKFEVQQIASKPHIDGKRTLGENIADIGGNKIAYYAYLLWAKENGDKGILPGFESYSKEKLFWIRSAQRFCSTYRDKTLKSKLSDPSTVHTILGFRTNGSTMFSAEFAKDFKCPKGSNMNPIKKCAMRLFRNEIKTDTKTSPGSQITIQIDKSVMSITVGLYFIMTFKIQLKLYLL